MPLIIHSIIWDILDAPNDDIYIDFWPLIWFFITWGVHVTKFMWYPHIFVQMVLIGQNKNKNWKQCCQAWLSLFDFSNTHIYVLLVKTQAIAIGE